MQKTKRCCKCGLEKPLEMFYRRRNTRSGYRSRCKICTDEDNSVGNKNYRDRHRERINKTKQERYALDPRPSLLASMRYYWSHKDHVLNQKKAYRKHKRALGDSEPLLPPIKFSLDQNTHDNIEFGDFIRDRSSRLVNFLLLDDHTGFLSALIDTGDLNEAMLLAEVNMTQVEQIFRDAREFVETTDM
mgnify:CR=1 FL=1